METKRFDVESENEKLTTQLNSIKGEYKIDEENLRAEIYEQFKNKFEFRESELEAMNIKL